MLILDLYSAHLGVGRCNKRPINTLCHLFQFIKYHSRLSLLVFLSASTEQHTRMASLKAVKPTGVAGQAKEPAKVSATKEPAKLSATATKPAAAKGGIKKPESKPRETKKRVHTTSS